MEQSRIRNFSIVAHIDHGKSTLADRILQLSGAVAERDMREQMLDSMDLERERGITIKAQAVRVPWTYDGEQYELNLIDTPGHVDFSYEVSRSLAACEGAILVVDAAQGLEAQTLANAHLALDNDLEIVPVLNKIDLPAADPEGVSQQVVDFLGGSVDEVLRISAKTGVGVSEVLDAVCERIPPPTGDLDAPARALVFDSTYDQYRGVIAFIRVVDGSLKAGDEIIGLQSNVRMTVEEIGVMTPSLQPIPRLDAGEVGFIVTGIKDVSEVRVGDTFTHQRGGATEPLPGYLDVKPMVFAGLFPTDADGYQDLRDALDRLRLNDASLIYEPETSQALGFGFRCGFLGLLHMDVVRERLEREFDLDLLVTTPNVAYEVLATHGLVEVHNPSQMPDANSIEEDARALREGLADRAQGVRGHHHGAGAGAARRVRSHGVPLADARAGALPAAARRDRARLLRPAEEPDEGLRLVRLRARRATARRTSSSSTSCSTAIPSTRSASSSTATAPTRPARRSSSGCAR